MSSNPVSNLTTSFILLALGLVILWLAATNRLSNFLTAWKALSQDPGTTSNLQSKLSQAMGGPATTNVNVPVTIPGLPPLTFPTPVPISSTTGGDNGTSQPPAGSFFQAASDSLGAGGGVQFRLPQLPSLGTITVH